MAFYRIVLSKRHFAASTATHYCILLYSYAGCAKSHLIEIMPHNDNYLCNILRQRLRYYRPAGEGSGEWACPLPRKKYNAIQVKLLTSQKDTVRNLIYLCARAPAQ